MLDIPTILRILAFKNIAIGSYSLIFGLYSVFFVYLSEKEKSLSSLSDRYLIVDQLFSSILAINIGIICYYGSGMTDFNCVKKLICALLIGTSSLILPMMIFDAVILNVIAPSFFWLLEIGEASWLMYAYFYGELIQIPESSDVHVTFNTPNGTYTKTYRTLPQTTHYGENV